VPAVDDARGREHGERFVGSLDMELVARRRVERLPPIGSDLRADPAVAQERERATRGGTAPEVEVQRPLSTSAKVKAPRGVEERGELGETVAFALRRDRRELLADVL
jgi:hypothetical protein